MKSNKINRDPGALVLLQLQITLEALEGLRDNHDMLMKAIDVTIKNMPNIINNCHKEFGFLYDTIDQLNNQNTNIPTPSNN